MLPFEELHTLSAKLAAASKGIEIKTVGEPLDRIEKAAKEVGKSFSGSWLGYHSRVYYAEFKSPPPGANFSQEWGLKGRIGLGSRGEWQEFSADTVKEYIWDMAGHPDPEPSRQAAAKVEDFFSTAKADIASILQDEAQSDSFVEKLRDELESLEPMTPHDVANHWLPKGQIITRDTLAMSQRNQIPPHIELLAEVTSIRHIFGICRNASDISRKAASHLERKGRKIRVAERIGTNVFIGHGRSSLWRELKDFVQDPLNLPWDEFNRVPVAGVTNIARLSEMLDAAAIALLIFTAEDEMIDGGLQARMNVIHEAGLFQGRLGFGKAIILLEEGCDEFSNIQGLGQIRFPKGNIAAIFEEVRRVLEREGLLDES